MRRVLVANRGEIACRILRTLRAAGYTSVAVFSTTDGENHAPHIRLADHAECLGGPLSYLDGPAVLAAAQRCDADAIHPGYGFLAESPEFARLCHAAGITFIGPDAAALAAFGDKRQARELAEAAGVALIPGAQACDTVAQAMQQARAVGFPVLLKAAAGGGGRGMRLVGGVEELEPAFNAAAREATHAFADGRLLLERVIENARHIEVQVVAGGGEVVIVGERECSLQRRYQKLLEEAPAAALDDPTRDRIHRDARLLMSSMDYRGVATVEFLVGADGSHYFLEVNTRLQVEHAVTEMCFGVDLVAWQLHLAASELPPSSFLKQALGPARGHALEARIIAEDPYAGFLPTTGEILFLDWPEDPFVRVDSGIQVGQRIVSDYDGLLAKVIAWGPTREQARRRLVAALEHTVVLGVGTTINFLIELLNDECFREQQTFTTTVETKMSAGEFCVPQLDTMVAEAVAQRLGPLASGAPADGLGDMVSPWQGADSRGFRNV